MFLSATLTTYILPLNYTCLWLIPRWHRDWKISMLDGYPPIREAKFTRPEKAHLVNHVGLAKIRINHRI